MPNPDGTPLGFELPENLATLSLDELHALHARTWPEAEEIQAKRGALMPFIAVRQAEANLASRAGFDQQLALGGGEESLLKTLAAKLGFTITKKEGE